MCRAFISLPSSKTQIKKSQAMLKHKLASKPSQKRPRPSVRFNSEEPKQIISSVSLPSSECSSSTALWYDDASMKRMRLDAISTVAMAMMGRTDTNLRGLEHHVSFELKAQKRERIEEYVNAVLDEQVEQWANDTTDPTRLAQIASELSKSQRERAVRVALIDQNEVLQTEC